MSWLVRALFGPVVLLLFLVCNNWLATVSPFSLYQQDFFIFFLNGLGLGFALALVVKSSSLGMLCGLMPLIAVGTIGSTDQAVWSFVFTFIAAWGFLGGFWLTHVLIQDCLLSWRFALDTSPKD